MKSNGRMALLAYNSVAAIAGAAAMFALFRSGWLDPSHTEEATAIFSETPRSGRLAFVQPGTLTNDTPEIAPDLKPTIATPQETSAAWSTETQPQSEPSPETAVPPPQGSRFTLLPSLRLPWMTPKPQARPKTYTLKTRLAEISPAASFRLAAKFEAAKAPWPPAEIALIAIKDEKKLELHARPAGGSWKLVHRYKVLAASGGTGPKLRQGDKQVPEGLYSISFLNPNSAYHVSMRVNYPNAFDKQMALKDGRKDLGGDIMIHGKNLSAGCLAMGDEAVEELFVLAAQTGLSNVKLIIAPTDFRENGVPTVDASKPEWLPKLYTEVATAMADFKQPKPTGLLSFFTK
jgi:hypothetical protein